MNNLMSNLYKKTSTPNRSATNSQRSSEDVFIIDRTGNQGKVSDKNYTDLEKSVDRDRVLSKTPSKTLTNSMDKNEHRTEKSETRRNQRWFQNQDSSESPRPVSEQDLENVSLRNKDVDRSILLESIDLTQDGDTNSRASSVISETSTKKRSNKVGSMYCLDFVNNSSTSCTFFIFTLQCTLIFYIFCMITV